MSNSSSGSKLQPCLIFFIIFCSSLSVFMVEALVPTSKTFKFVIQGTAYSYNEYKADYRETQISNHPFSLCFYNTTPNAYVLALGMGIGSENSILRWVWAANQARPVRENAVLSFGRNGNLVIVDVDGWVTWQTRTANMGVVDIKLLPNGNLVLLNEQGGYVWQSFDYPTDTLLNGQGLRPNGVSNKLVSRLSDVDDSPGPYSMVINGDGKPGIPLYFKSKLPDQKPLKYADMLLDYTEDKLENLTFYVNSPIPEFGPDYSNQLGLHLSGDHETQGLWVQPKYNSTLSFLRLGWDGNLHVYTYYEKGYYADAWEEAFTYFSRDGLFASECRLPEKCGSFGLCSKGQCVACPTPPQGLLGWSEDCKAPKLPSCTDHSSTSYYEIEGVDHFVSSMNEGEGPMKIDECKKKCSNDCKCAAFFYRKDTSKCLITTQLNTLTKVVDSSKDRVAFIKYAKQLSTLKEVL